MKTISQYMEDTGHGISVVVGSELADRVDRIVWVSDRLIAITLMLQDSRLNIIHVLHHNKEDLTKKRSSSGTACRNWLTLIGWRTLL